MGGLLSGMSGVTVYLDGISITGSSDDDHLATLEQVLQKLATVGIHLSQKKCIFTELSVVCLGHRISSEGLHPVAEKVKAVQEVPESRNLTEFKSFLGFLSYYSHFLCNLSTVLAPLYRLLRKSQKWCWTSAEQASFTKAKQLFLSSGLLVHFDPNLPITLSLRCLGVWHWCSPVAPHVRWIGKANCFHFVYTLHD